MIEILYEDNHLLVAVKPPNMLSQADHTGDTDILSELKEYIRTTYHKPGAVYLGLVHRLDRPVGGLMVFAKTSKAAARLSEQMRVHRIGREYLCVCEGTMTAPISLTDYLVKDEKRNIVTVCAEGTAGAKKAVLHATPLATWGDTSLVAIRLETGRNHQIRVQLAHAGHPLWGDARYGNGVPGQQIALWGYRLTVEHPTKHEIMTFVHLPQGSVWHHYTEALKAIPSEQAKQTEE